MWWWGYALNHNDTRIERNIVVVDMLWWGYALDDNDTRTERNIFVVDMWWWGYALNHTDTRIERNIVVVNMWWWGYVLDDTSFFSACADNRARNQNLERCCHQTLNHECTERVCISESAC
jgi:hypothetical protein